MKPSRPPVCTIGNPVIVYDQRITRPTSTKNTTETRQVIRCLSQNHENQAVTYAYFPQQPRASSPTAVTRFQPKEPVMVPQFQNLPMESFSAQHKKVVSMDYTTPTQESQVQKLVAEVSQKNQLILDLQEQISDLQNKLSERLSDYQQLKEKFDTEFKKFQDEVATQIKGIDLNIQLNDYTQYFMQEIDRKVLNLQTNLNGQLDEIKQEIENKLKQTEHLSKNLLSNTTIRLNQDEQHFQQELALLSNNLQQKIERSRAEQLINQQLNAIQSQYQTQLQQAHALISKINSDKNDEILKIKATINNTLMQVNQQAQNQLQQMMKMVQENLESSTSVKQNSQQLKQQLKGLTQKFQQIQTQFQSKMTDYQNKIKNLEDNNFRLQKEIEQSQTIIQKQQQEIYKISEANKVLKSPIVQQVLSPKNCKSTSFYTNSTSAGLNFTKNRPQSQQRKMKKQHQPHQFEISLEDFADFNENSILDSNDSIEFLSGEAKSSRIQSPKNPFKSSQLININRLLNEDFHKAPQFVSSINKQKENNNPLQAAIKRRLLYLGKQQKTLLCTYQSEQLYDAEMGMQLLDDNGQPFIVSESEKNELIAKQLIQLV